MVYILNFIQIHLSEIFHANECKSSFLACVLQYLAGIFFCYV